MREEKPTRDRRLFYFMRLVGASGFEPLTPPCEGDALPLSQAPNLVDEPILTHFNRSNTAGREVAKPRQDGIFCRRSTRDRSRACRFDVGMRFLNERNSLGAATMQTIECCSRQLLQHIERKHGAPACASMGRPVQRSLRRFAGSFA